MLGDLKLDVSYPKLGSYELFCHANSSLRWGKLRLASRRLQNFWIPAPCLKHAGAGFAGMTAWWLTAEIRLTVNLMSINIRMEKIKALLQATLSPTTLEIEDEGQFHAGHDGAKAGKGYFFISITSEKFRGKTRVAQHQMVYGALKEMLETDIHALRLKTGTP